MFDYIKIENHLNELKNLLKNYEYLDEAEKNLEKQGDLQSKEYLNIFKKEKVYLFNDIIDKAQFAFIPLFEDIKYIIEHIDDDCEFINSLSKIGIEVDGFNIFFISSMDNLFCSYFPFYKIFKLSEKYSKDFFASFPVNIDLDKLQLILKEYEKIF